jgi:hypothetical protein
MLDKDDIDFLIRILTDFEKHRQDATKLSPAAQLMVSAIEQHGDMKLVEEARKQVGKTISECRSEARRAGRIKGKLIDIYEELSVKELTK